MKRPRRTFLHLAAGASALPALSRIASAQAHPSRPVHVIVAASAGGGMTLADLGGTVMMGSPADFAKFIAEETEKWAKVIKFAGIKPG